MGGCKGRRPTQAINIDKLAEGVLHMVVEEVMVVVVVVVVRFGGWGW